MIAGRTRLATGAGLQAWVGADGVAVLLVDRPDRRNALTAGMWAALPDLLAGLAADARVRALLVSGAGGTFSAGADIAELAQAYADPGRAEAYHATIVAAEEELAGFARPTLAVVRGACVGGGCQLAVACDVRLADPAARFGITPAKLGIVYPAGATGRLVGLLGPARAKYLLFSAELVPAHRAAELGLVDEVVPDGALEERAVALARGIAGLSPITLGAAKEVVRTVTDGADPHAVAAAWQRRAAGGADARERMAAFLRRD